MNRPTNGKSPYSIGAATQKGSIQGFSGLGAEMVQLEADIG